MCKYPGLTLDQLLWAQIQEGYESCEVVHEIDGQVEHMRYRVTFNNHSFYFHFDNIGDLLDWQGRLVGPIGKLLHNREL